MLYDKINVCIWKESISEDSVNFIIIINRKISSWIGLIVCKYSTEGKIIKKLLSLCKSCSFREYLLIFNRVVVWKKSWGL